MTGTDGKEYILVKPRMKHRDGSTFYVDIPEAWRLRENKTVVDGAIELWIQDGNERKINNGEDITKNHISPMAYAAYIREYLQKNGKKWGINDKYYVVNINSFNPDWSDEFMKLPYVGIKPTETLRAPYGSKTKKQEEDNIVVI